MSDKHLTESPWKTLATKQKFKDPALGKALAAYENLGENEFQDRLKALEKIESEVASLLKDKEVKKNEDLSDYLEEVDREIPKARRLVAAAEKKAEESEGDEEEEEDDGKDAGAIKKKMLALLNQVKTKGPEDKQLRFMALIAKGQSAVLLGKAVGAGQKKALLEMVPNVQGPKFVTGDCVWESNAHTFVVEKVPSGLGKKVQKALMAETGIKWKVRVRSLDGSEASDADDEQEVAEEEGEEAAGPQEATAPQEGVPNAPPPPPPEKRAAFMERLKVLKPEMDKVIAANVAASAETKTLFAELAGLARGGDFDGALAEFDRLETLVKTGSRQMAEPAQEADIAGKFRERLAAFLPKLKEVVTANPPLGGEIRTVVMEAGAQAKAGNYNQANALMDRAQGLVPGAATPPPTTQAPPQAPPEQAPQQQTSQQQTPSPQQTQAPSNEPNGDAPSNEQEQTGEQETGEQQTGDQQAEDPETLFGQKFAELEPDYLEAVKAAPGNEVAEGLISRLKAIWNLAGAKAEGGAYPVALRAFEAVVKEDLFNKIKEARGSGAGIEKGLVEKRKFLVTRFQQILPVLNAEMAKLKVAITAELPEGEDPDELTTRIQSYLESFVGDLQDEIDDAITAGNMKQVAGLRARIEGDEMLKHLLSNPFVDGAKFQSEVLDAVSEVEAKLAA